MIKNLRRYENLHIFLWLIKDTCWVMDLKTMGLLIAIPTVLVAFHITWLHRKDMAELLHNISICSWICANIIWMIGEFFFNDGTRPYAIVFFTVGLLFVSSYYFYYLPFVESKKKSADEEPVSDKSVRFLIGKMMVGKTTEKNK